MPEEKKIILSMSIHDDKDKSKAMTIVSGIGGVSSISMDTKDYKLTIIGDVDPVKVTEKLRKKSIPAEIVSVGPAKEPEKKKEEPKKDDEAEKKKVAELLEAYKNCRLPCMPDGRYYYYVHSAEENPNACVIC